jgi:molybdate transport system permease protein
MAGSLLADVTALWLSLRLALVTSLSLLVLCTPLALWLGTSRARIVPWVHALVSLPLVLPPTVLGFYLLLLLGREGAVGRLFSWLGGAAPTFSFTGLWLASLVASAPFVVQPLHTAFSGLGRRPWEAAQSLRASPWDAFFSVILPLSRRAYAAAFVLSFAHTLGEFGVVLMVGGNIPGRTQTISMVLFSHAEALDYAAAHRLAALLVLLSFGLVIAVHKLGRVPSAREPV